VAAAAWRDSDVHMTKLPFKPPTDLGPDAQLPTGQELASERVWAADTEMLRDRDYDEKRIMRAWEHFVISGRLEGETGMIRPAIRHSWERSATLGVDAHGRGSAQSTSNDALERLRRENEDLLVSARTAFQRITEIIGETGAMAVVTDAQGVILDVGGSRRTIERAHDIRLEVGAAWGESVAGTNGIGTALSTGRPVHVHAAEHFCEGVKAWACVGVPIRDPLDGSVIGLVDLSGPQGLFHRYNLALVMLSAGQIQQMLVERANIERISLLEASLDRVRHVGSSDGMILLDQFGRVLHFDEVARRRWPTLGAGANLRIGERLARSETGAVTDLGLRLPEPLTGHSLEPLMRGGAVRGAMLVLGGKPRPSVAVRIPETPLLTAAKARIIGSSEPLLQAVDRVVRAARGRTAILLEGETGVGKELFAQLAHTVGSTTGHEPFVALNCGAISKDLLGGELFGHAPGAFTGATREGRAGRFEQAHGGTLSLDEIGEMPLDLQPYLLRALEERAVTRLGDSKPRPVDVRLVASTNRNLKLEVEQGRFRRDLFYRISVVRITIPPLRQRSDDIAALIEHYNRELSIRHGCPPLRFEPDVFAFLQRYDWPGNVRELRNLIEGLVLLSSGEPVGFTDLPEEMIADTPAGRDPLPPVASQHIDAALPTDRLEDAKRRAIEQAIADANGNVSVAASRLGVARSTIYRQIHHLKGRRRS
jgi:transcriptional regulator of acetoin/glycerol metabolism